MVLPTAKSAAAGGHGVKQTSSECPPFDEMHFTSDRVLCTWGGGVAPVAQPLGNPYTLHLPAELTVKHTETQRVAMELGTNFKANHKAITAKGPAKPALFFLALSFAFCWLAPMAPRPRFSLCALPSPSFGKPLTECPPMPHARPSDPGAL
jgi:hypothetical protein